MTLQVIQISDCHLFADRDQELRGVLTRPRFEAVVNEIRTRFPAVDRILVTGDTAHDELESTCVAVHQTLGELADRVRIIPGNHDNRAALNSVFSLTELCPGRVVFHDSVQGWHLIGLDSHIPGEVAGELGAEQLAWLSDELKSCGNDPVLVCVHHPPVRLRSRWLDEIGMADADAMRSILSDAANVRLVCSGHVHQEHFSSQDGLTFLTTPAVGPHFRSYSDTLVLDTSPPMIRLLELEPDGSWFTQILRVPMS